MQAAVCLEIIQFIKIEYAHEHTAYDYTYKLETGSASDKTGSVCTGVIEIGTVKHNPLVFKGENSRTYTACEGDIFIIPPQSRFEVYAQNPGLHKHITTEALIKYRACDNASSPGTLLLPTIIKASPATEKIIEAIKKIVAKSSFLKKTSYFEECADYMRLLAEINECTKACEPTDNAIPPSCRLYCSMAEKYAMDNISRHIKIEEIASHIGISKNYLTNIFSRYKGMPITEYINRMKLNHMLELMLRFNYTAREAGEYVGIDNVNYISRIFRKYYGMTISEYKRLNF